MLTRRKKIRPVTGVRVVKNSNHHLIQAAGGLIFKISEDIHNPDLLLIYRNDVWDLPKGKLEDGESIATCAQREVQEEIGLSIPPNVIAELGTTYHSYTLKGQSVEKETFWFVMQLSRQVDDFTPEQAEGITKVEWMPATQALQNVGYDNLEEIIRRFLNNNSNLDKVDDKRSGA